MSRLGWRGLGGAVLLGALGLGLMGCNDTSTSDSSRATDVKLEPATASNGQRIQQVTMSPLAESRLGLRTTTVQGDVGNEVVPYGSLIYDNEGSAWVYVTSKPHTFVRAPVTVAAIDGDTVHLSAGPAAGAEVVTVGAAELFGAERGY
jgi:hypothetical protein